MRKSLRQLQVAVVFFTIISIFIGVISSRLLLQQTLFTKNFWFDCLGYGGIWLSLLWVYDVFNIGAVRKTTFFFRKIVGSFIIALLLTVVIRLLTHAQLQGIQSNILKNALITLVVTLFLLVVTIFINKSTVQRVLIVGGGATGRAIVRELWAQRIIKTDIIGFLSDKQSDSMEIYEGDEIEEIKTTPRGTVPCLGMQDTLRAIIKHSFTTILIIAKDRKLDKQLVADIEYAKHNGIKVFFADEIFEVFSRKLPVMHLNSDYFYYIFRRIEGQEQSFSFYTALTRSLNLLFALTGLLLSIPFMLFFGVLFCCCSKGPMFFAQKRVGKFGKPFTIYKLRTMHIHDPKHHSKYSSRDDSRIPWIGKVMRKLRVDEFPQFWNILIGDMNLVGPRPEWTELVEKYEKEIPFYHQRHIVRPGITGWAQVNYPYGSSVKDSIYKLQYDLYYVKNAGILLDALIILKTIQIVISGKGL